MIVQGSLLGISFTVTTDYLKAENSYITTLNHSFKHLMMKNQQTAK
jgi:hypothetical protein